MSYLVIARKYRPQTFEEVVGQGHVTRTLKNAISQGRIAHAYLFSGPRGVGKTTVARLMAKALNCEKGPTPEPCNQCPMCRGIVDGSVTDVYEIDGASNTGVDDIRELRENVRYLPSAGRYNVYIIDEVHMLSINAFNALLKILEEPPAHVIFIFATTESHKIPVTILSRTQRFDFKRISAQEIKKRLSDIAVQEGITAADGALTVISREAAGSMRDAQSLLDQVIGYAGTSISEESVREVLGLTDRALLFKMIEAVAAHDPSLAIYNLSEVYNQGYDIVQYYRELVDLMRNLLLLKAAPTISTPDLTAEERQELAAIGEPLSIDELTLIFNILFSAEFSIKSSSDPRIAMELVLIKMTRTASVESIAEVIERISLLEGGNAGTPAADGASRSFDFETKTAQAKAPPEKAAPAERTEPSEVPDTADGAQHAGGGIAEEMRRFLSYLSGRDPVIHSYLVYAVSMRIEGNTVVIELPKKYLHLLSGKDKIEMIQKEFREYFKRDLTVSLVGVEGQFTAPVDEEPMTVSEGGDPFAKILDSRTAKNVKKVFSEATVEGYTPRKK
jgi:DNA polymerase-3 subunit gamma/tau